MEEQTVNSQIQQPNTPTPQEPKRHSFLSSKSFLISLAITVFVLLLVVGSIYIFNLRLQKQMFPPSPEPPLPPKITLQPSQNQDETANWKTYISPDNAFSFKYPSDWEYEATDLVFIIKGKEYSTTSIKFGEPVSEEERGQLGYIDINDAPKVYFRFSLNYTSHTDFTNLTVGNLVEELINKRSSIVDDPRTLLIDNNIQAKEVGYACQEYCVDVLFKNNTTIFDASTGPSGSALTQRQILSTFKFIDKDETVCTQDVRQCPDGKTYVGREGPNCEFAPCP